jgi:hypothetical protein
MCIKDFEFDFVTLQVFNCGKVVPGKLTTFQDHDLYNVMQMHCKKK